MGTLVDHKWIIKISVNYIVYSKLWLFRSVCLRWVCRRDQSSIRWAIGFGWLQSRSSLFAYANYIDTILPMAFKITILVRSFREWCGWLTWWATGLSRLRWLLSDRCPAKRTWSAFSVSPTYWIEPWAHSIKYTTFLVLQWEIGTFTRTYTLSEIKGWALFKKRTRRLDKMSGQISEGSPLGNCEIVHLTPIVACWYCKEILMFCQRLNYARHARFTIAHAQ